MSPCGFIPDQSNSDYLWPYADIESYLNQLPGLSPFIETVTIGDSFELRPIKAIRFGNHSLSAPLPTVFIVATQHAQEWGAAGTAVGLIRGLSLTITNQSYRPALYDALQHAAIVGPCRQS